MRGIFRTVGPTTVAAGAVLVGYSVATGGAHLYLLVVFPLISGTSPTFLAGVLLLIAGIFLLPMSFRPTGEAEDVELREGLGPSSTRSGGSGGLVLVGPIPIFFGAWKTHPPISYRWASVLGAVLVVVALLLLWGFSIL